MDLTDKLSFELKRLGRSETVKVQQKPDGSIVGQLSRGGFITLAQSKNKAVCYGSSSVKEWANKIDSHLDKCARGDYHKQYGEIEKHNRDVREKQGELRRDDLVRAFDKAREEVRRGRIYFT